MALTRKSLKAMGLTDEQVDSIVEMHTETVDGLKEKLKTAEEKATQLEEVQKELDNLKAKSADGYEEKYKAEKKAFEDYKAGILAKETRAAKEKAVRQYIAEHDFDGKKISGDNLDIAMLAVASMIDGVELDGEKLKKTDNIDEIISGKLSRLAGAEKTVGAKSVNPPANNGAPGAPVSRAAQLAAKYHANLYGETKK